MFTFCNQGVDITTTDTFHTQLLDTDTLQYTYRRGDYCPVLIQGREMFEWVDSWEDELEVRRRVEKEEVKFGMGEGSTASGGSGLKERNKGRGGWWVKRWVGLEAGRPSVCLSDGRQTPWGRTQPGCSEESSWASPWGRYAAAASRCPVSHTLSCCRMGLRDTQGTQGGWLESNISWGCLIHTVSTVHQIKQKMLKAAWKWNGP